MKLALVLAPLAVAGVLAAQTPRTVRASGSAVISVKPDLARVTVGVETTATTAQDAATQNAATASNVLSALRGVLGSSGTTETVSYTISATYRGQPAVLTGYTVTNMIEVTTFDMANVGRLIDAASGAGANRIQGLSFGIQDPDPVTRQALTAAAKQARGHAEAIAAGLGGRVGMVLSAQESSAAVPINRVGIAAAAPTPIETGLVEVRASVAVEMEYIPAST